MSKRGPITFIVLGALMVIARIWLPSVSESGSPVTLGEAQSVCNSSLGALGAAFSREVASRCSEINAIMNVLNVVGVIGAAGIVAGAAMLIVRSRAREV